MQFPSLNNWKRTFVSFSIAAAAIITLAALPTYAQKTDAVGYSINQCANGKRGLPKVQCAGAQWQNGNINSNQAQYREGDSVPYRTIITGLTPGSTGNVVTIEWDTTKNGFHAIDYITSFDRTETDALPCSGVTGCVAGSATTWPIPTDPTFLANCAGCTQIPGNFTIYGGTITNVSSYTTSGTYAGDSATQITLTFTANQSTVVIAWGGHISTRFDWGFDGTAIDINGSPYHMRLKNVTGNQDRSMQLDAIIFAASLRITKLVEAIVGFSHPRSFDFTSSANSGLGSFSLIDNNPAQFEGGSVVNQQIFAFGAANTITVTEADLVGTGWSLSNLACDETSGGLPQMDNSTVNLGTRTATIIVEEAEVINCTFTNQQLAPSAAPASVSGRVMSASGRGLAGVYITIYNTNSGIVYSTTSNTFGYYTINDLPISDFYVMTASSKRHMFMDASRSFTLDEDMFGVNFVAAEDQ